MLWLVLLSHRVLREEVQYYWKSCHKPNRHLCLLKSSQFYLLSSMPETFHCLKNSRRKSILYDRSESQCIWRSARYKSSRLYLLSLMRQTSRQEKSSLWKLSHHDLPESQYIWRSCTSQIFTPFGKRTSLFCSKDISHYGKILCLYWISWVTKYASTFFVSDHLSMICI